MQLTPPNSLRQWFRRACLGGVLAIALLPFDSGWAAGRGGDAEGRLNAVQRDLERSRAEALRLGVRATELRRTAAELRGQMVITARAIQSHEVDVARFDAEIIGLNATTDDRLARLQAERGRFSQIILAVQRMARYPPVALLAQPQDLNDMVRGAILLRAAVPAVEQRAASLRAELAAIARLRSTLEHRRLERDETAHALERKRKRLAGLAASRVRESAATELVRQNAFMRAELLSREARDLRDLLARLAQQRIARLAAEAAAKQKVQQQARYKAAQIQQDTAIIIVPSPLAKRVLSIRQARGMLPFPAVGQITGRYGDLLGSSGPIRKGIVIETLPAAQVVAPYDGDVVFAGLFRGYGLLLIIEHDEEYHTLLTGLSRIDAVIGQRIIAGEPVGVMGQLTPEPPNLYVELRRAGQPINPLPWLAVHKGKVTG